MKCIVKDMTCKHCVMKIKNALEEVGAKNIDINLETKVVEFDFDQDFDIVKNAILDVGYSVEVF